MAERQSIRHDKAAEKATAILQELLRDFPARDFAIELWDGTRWHSEPSKFCRFTWHIHNPRVLQALFRPDRDWLWPSPIYRVISTSAGSAGGLSRGRLPDAQRIHFGREDAPMDKRTGWRH